MSLLPINSSAIQKFVSPASNRVFVTPSTQVDKDRVAVANSLVSNLNSKNYFSYATSLSRVILGDLGATSGVNFDTFVAQPGDNRNGYFSQYKKTFFINKKFLGDSQEIGMLTYTIAHELTHHRQAELDLNAKYFGPRQRNIKVGHSTMLENLINPGGKPYGDRYFLSKMEQEAFTRSGNFTIGFLTVAKQFAEKEGNTAQVEFLDNQIGIVTKEDEAFWRESSRIDKSFIQGGKVKDFCDQMQKTFDEFYSVAQASVGQKPISEADKANFTRLVSIPELQIFKSSQEKTFTVLANVLGRYPKRECVEQYLDLALSSNIAGVMPMALNRLVEQGVPFTRQDFTRSVLCTDYYRGDNASLIIAPHTFSRVDESVWVRDLVAAHGVARAYKICKNIQNTPDLPCTVDFGKVKETLESFDQGPIMNVGGVPVYGTAQILDLAVRELIAKGQITDKDYFRVKNHISKNLSDIVNSFEDISGNNHEYVTALARFVRDPFKQQFEVKEEISELGACFNVRAAQAVEKTIRERRQAETHVETPDEEEDVFETGEEVGGNPFVKKVNREEFSDGPRKKPTPKKTSPDDVIAQIKGKGKNLSTEDLERIMAIINKTDSFVSAIDAAVLTEYGIEDGFVPVSRATSLNGDFEVSSDGCFVKTSEEMMPQTAEEVKLANGFEIEGKVIPHEELKDIEITTPQAGMVKPQAAPTAGAEQSM